MTATKGLASPESPGQVRAASGGTKFRPEIQGLRSLAVLMVVSYHIWFGRVSGGVDVFLLISAFLMTLQFVSRYEDARPVSLVRHWLHLFWRLLPAVVVVLLSTLAATYVFIPRTRWIEIVSQGWASLFYVQNWLLQRQVVNYYAADHSLASPFQHFWSLSIQGQVFILWPAIFVATAWVCRRLSLRYRAVLLGIFGLIFAVSLAYSIYFTAANQELAYFDTFARLWEFALGTLVALLLPYLRPGLGLSSVLGWVGIAAMLSCGAVLQVQTAFPGFVALWPTLAAVAVIVAGQSGSRFGVDRILSSKLLVGLGSTSYALYLWHWPLLVITLVWIGQDHADAITGTLIVGASLLLAFLTTRFVEQPLRAWRWPEAKRWRLALAVLVCLAVAAAPMVQFGFQQQAEKNIIATQDADDNPGARALLPGYVDRVGEGARTLPTPEQLPEDWGRLDGACIGDLRPADPVLFAECQQNDVGADAERTVFVVGQSHSLQWLGAIGPLAKEHHWRVQAITFGACPFMTETDEVGDECNTFNRNVREHIRIHQPDAVFLVGTAAVPDSPDEDLTWGLDELVGEITDQGVEVIAMRDNPRFSFSPSECAMASGVDDSRCRPAQSSVLAESNPLDQLEGTFTGLSILDMTDLICDGTACPGIVGNVYVYLDDNHLSSTYVRTMTDTLSERWFDATGW
ncbi:acyltransferase family protein [Arthrobacter sp. Rue61a]|uniref:acyltransferase family protein n=1 Tax=Arthrobacter sp. Rue61a TaxID=1118963 RepID=UPI00027DF7BF|nr:acyltransferase family protein [Arthrobacter sp. Rue61a]AFR29475.1 acyltransferase family protein [Arthrobacter sp. Rue61a]